MLVDRLNGVIINGDATKIYKDLNIGSNKYPIFRTNHNVRLLDTVHFYEDYTVGEYYRDARSEIESIIKEKKTPIVVGGSGLYLRWLLYGKQSGPRRDHDLTQNIINELKTLPWSEVLKRVAKYDEKYASILAENDVRRASRAIEIGMTTGKGISSFNQQQLTEKKGEEVDGHSFEHLDYDFRCFTLTKPRTALYDRISYRCEDMVQNGLLEEVWDLMKRGFNPEYNAGKAVGYKQSIEFLKKGDYTSKTFLDYLSDIKSKSRQLAHRQISWFRGEPLYHWVDCSNNSEAVEEVFKCWGMDFYDFHKFRQNAYKTSSLHHPEQNTEIFKSYLPPHYLYTAKHVTRSEAKKGISKQSEMLAHKRTNDKVAEIRYLTKQNPL